LGDVENDVKKMVFRGWRKIEPVEKDIHGY